MERFPSYADTSTSGPPSTSAPLGIKLYCAIAALVALYPAWVSIAALSAGGQVQVLGALLAALTVGIYVVLYGLWTVRSWAWWWGIALFGLDVVLSLVTLDLLGLVIGLALLGYLYVYKPVYLYGG